MYKIFTVIKQLATNNIENWKTLLFSYRNSNDSLCMAHANYYHFSKAIVKGHCDENTFFWSFIRIDRSKIVCWLFTASENNNKENRKHNDRKDGRRSIDTILNHQYLIISEFGICFGSHSLPQNVILHISISICFRTLFRFCLFFIAL